MPLDKLALILVVVMAAAGLTVWIAYLAAGAPQMPGSAWTLLIPLALGAYVLWRAISDRLISRGDDRHDRTGK
ncbi:hypothetical protein [Tranquillimonas rosea]|uniref:hypothetical protein n=1 Tax=Tranquillimonas rosea TaxID=641238 RepID=UPI003BA889FA